MQTRILGATDGLGRSECEFEVYVAAAFRPGGEGGPSAKKAAVAVFEAAEGSSSELVSVAVELDEILCANPGAEFLVAV